MTQKDAIQMMEDPMMSLRGYFDRALYTMQDICENFFEAQVDPNNQKEWRMMAHDFKRNAVRAEIVYDALAHMLSDLGSIESLFQEISKEGAA